MLVALLAVAGINRIVRDASETIDGNRLQSALAQHEAYHLQPSQELLDLIETYRKKARQAEG